MDENEKLSLDEIEEIRRRRPGVRASLACEGLILTAEEEALFDSMEEERLGYEQRTERLLEFDRARRRRKSAAVA